MDLEHGHASRTPISVRTNPRYRRWVEIGEGTHMVLLEKNRLQAFDAINQFLSEQYEHD
ncbi:hypothetical protein [Bradyrhizobium sp. 187]|uniref:hypothetical protein n=1 Tax=Bradyrhizobium sp. 187 TaxID=2782655 RepID=UPI001FFE3D22|nr:hypothetical protein [Bradyrhizobium sp. 187]